MRPHESMGEQLSFNDRLRKGEPRASRAGGEQVPGKQGKAPVPQTPAQRDASSGRAVEENKCEYCSGSGCKQCGYENAPPWPRSGRRSTPKP